MGLTKKQMKTLLKAQRGEREAVIMYRRLVRVVDGVDDALAFIRLSDDEARHEEVFRNYTGRRVIASPVKAIAIPLMYKIIGKEKLYPLIARGEYDAADKYQNIIADFPDVESVMNDEVHHGDAVMGLLRNK